MSLLSFREDRRIGKVDQEREGVAYGKHRLLLCLHIGSIIHYSMCVCNNSGQPAQVALVVKNQPANAGDMTPWFDPWLGKILWRGACQYSCLGKTMDRGAWRVIAHMVSKGQT